MSNVARSDAYAVAGYLDRVAVKTPTALVQLVTHAALLGLAKVKANAAGRPGPRRVTGDYTRSMNIEFTLRPGGAEAVIGTNAVQARRLEYGFHGTDSLGRHYSQDPLPHWGPMGEWLEQRLENQAGLVVSKAVDAA